MWLLKNGLNIIFPFFEIIILKSVERDKVRVWVCLVCHFVVWQPMETPSGVIYVPPFIGQYMTFLPGVRDSFGNIKRKIEKYAQLNTGLKLFLLMPWKRQGNLA